MYYFREGGKDNQEIVDLLKMRKIIHVDLIEAVLLISFTLFHS